MRNDRTYENSTISKDTLELLDRLYPGDIIEILSDLDESYLWEFYEELRFELFRMDGASVDYDRDWRGDDAPLGCCWRSPGWDDDDEEYGEPSVEESFSSSYHLLFLGLKDDRFHYLTEDETVDDDDDTGEDLVEGEGSIGCCLALCLSAPLAVIVPATKSIYRDGSQSLPDIFPNVFEMSGEPADMEEHIRALTGEEGVQAVRDLTNRIAGILASYNIPLLSADDAKKPVPWLTPDEGVLHSVVPGEALTVQDAVFFRFF